MPSPTTPAPRGATTFAYGYNRDPYPLEPGPHLFIDWRYVFPGWISYSSEGQGTQLFQHQEQKNVRGHAYRVPFGIELAAVQAEKTGPLVPNDREWEFMMGYCSLHDLGGKFGLWYEVVPPGGYGGKNLICYAESEDGKKWVKPELGLVEFGGSKRNNIVIDGAKCPFGGLHGNSVFIDNLAPENERFKIVYMSYSSEGPDEAILRKLKEESPASIDEFGEQMRTAILLGTSPDGLRWTFSDQILFSHMCDSQTCVYYDEFLGKWVLYTRTYPLGRRGIGRAETGDMKRWPVPETILWMHGSLDPSIDLYCNSKSLYPGTRTMHVMFPTLYLRRADTCALGMASSPDGVAWSWLPERIMECGPDGSWDAGCLFGGVGLTHLPGDLVALPYQAYEYPHKYPRSGRVGRIGLALWKRERLAAMQAEEVGEFWTVNLKAPGDQLYLNFEAKMPGYVKVGVEGVDNRGVDDCDLLVGDHLKKLVTWKGQSSIGVPKDKPFCLRFQLKAAKLFSFEFR